MTTEEPQQQRLPKVLSPCSSGRRIAAGGDSSSPEFEFWMVRNPSFPQPNLLSADELFSDGVLLPLQLLHPNNHSTDDPNLTPAAENEPEPETEPEPSGSDESNGGSSAPGSTSVLPVLSSAPAPTTSKRWKDIIFKKTDRRSSSRDGCDETRHLVKEKRKEKKGSGSSGNNPLSAAELNINIWPFSRSRSAGNGGSRPRMVSGGSRKVSSAPCSRSNSAGESKSRKWPSSPSRGGVHLGRNSPVWQVRRSGSGSTGKGSNVQVASKNAEKPVKKEEGNRRKTTGAVSGGGAAGKTTKVLQLNVPMCIGYRHHLSCRSDENSAVSVSTAATAAVGGTCGGSSSSSGGDGDGSGNQRGAGNNSDEGIRGSNLFNFRNLFTKKVH